MCTASPRGARLEAAGDQELQQQFPEQRGRWLQQWYPTDCRDEKQKRKNK